MSILSTAMLLFSTLFISQNAQAQWWENSTSIYPSTITKKVGIGMNNPSYPLHVNGKAGIKASSLTSLTVGGVVEIMSTDKNFYLNLDGNKLQATKTSSMFMYSANALLLNPYGGSVGVGTSIPAEAKLVVEGTVGNTVAMFRKNATSQGLSLVTDWPGLYFNSYYNGGSKSMASGFAGIVNFDPNYGRIDFGVTSTAAPASNTAVDLTTRMCINKDGNIGVGTGSPVSRLDVMGQDGLSITGYQPFYTLLDNYSNRSNRIQSANGDFIVYRGVGTAGYVAQMIVKDNGNVLIGTASDPGYKLAVNGKVICTELKVQLKSAWPDYVFADNYQLKSLEEVEAHIKSENHLPGIPAAAEIEKEGLEVGDMQKKMMEKIEEFTLYMIEINKENKALKQRLEQLEANK